MSLQLSFEDTLKLVPPVTEDDCIAVLMHQGDTYDAYANAIYPQGVKEESTYWRIVFSLLSVFTSLNANEAAYKVLRECPSHVLRSDGLLARTLSGVRGVYKRYSALAFPNTKARYISAFTQAYWSRHGVGYLPTPHDLNHYRHNLAEQIHGLSMAKASFAAALMYPTVSDVVCIDRHIARMLGHTRTSFRKGEYQELEQRIVNIGRQCGYPGFVTQWCLWDALRGSDEPHSSLIEKKAEL